jgi:2-C-methyl-D-erythritol 4-phosphate cytidylyltransferase
MSDHFPSDQENFAVIVAGGKGLRMASLVRKQYLDLLGLPVLARTLISFVACKDIKTIVVVVPPQDMTFCRDTILKPQGLEPRVDLVAGGSDRQESVRNGLLAVKILREAGKSCLVMVHDGVRPFADHAMIQRCLEAAREHGAVVPVVPVKDTLVRGDKNGFAIKTIDRTGLFQVQTPQCFDFDLVLAAHDHALATCFSGTDDASLVEHLGHRVFMTQGSAENIKITTRDDLVLARAIARLECLEG